ncbi:MAG: transposase [Bacteroidota bacterium]
MSALEENSYYHLFNRGNNRRMIFRDKDDYQRFLESMAYYLFPVFEIISYCLMPNHFHLIVRVRSEEEQRDLFDEWKSNDNSWKPYGLQFETFKYLDPGRQFSHLKNSYTQYFNAKYDKSGSLLESKFQRKTITKSSYLNHAICYVHCNPVRHNMISSAWDYPYSSLIRYVGKKSSILPREEVFERFAGFDGYRRAHDQYQQAIMDGRV